MSEREPHVYTPKHDKGRDCCLYCGRPFQTYVDQPDTAERKRREMQAIEWALPEKSLRQSGGSRTHGPSAVTRDYRLSPSASEPISHSGTAAAAPPYSPPSVGNPCEPLVATVNVDEPIGMVGEMTSEWTPDWIKTHG
jgi:hypothetical protein